MANKEIINGSFTIWAKKSKKWIYHDVKVGLTSIERNGVVQNLTQKMGEQK